MFDFKNASIQKKFTIGSIFVSIFVLFLTCLVFIFYDHVTFRRGMVRDLSSIVHIMAQNTSSAIVFDDPSSAQKVLKSLKFRPHIFGAYVYDAKGQLFASYVHENGYIPDDFEQESRHLKGHMYEDSNQRNWEFHKGFVELFSFVFLDEKKIGRIIIVSDLQGVTERMREYTFFGVIILFVSFGLVFVISFFVSRPISNPIRQLTSMTEKIAQGDLSQKIDIDSRDEIGVLAKTINQMTRDLANAVGKEKKLAAAAETAAEAEKKRAEELQVARDYTENIIRSMSDGLVVISPGGAIKTINQAMLDLLGYEQSELVGQPIGLVFAAEEKEEKEIFKGMKFQELIKEGSIKNYELTYKTKSGEKIPASFSGSAIRSQDGKLTGIVGIARDMREVNELRTKVVEGEKMTVLGKLAGIVSHEIRNPLNSMKSSLYFIASRLPDAEEKVKKHLGILERSVDSSEKIVSDILGFARVREPVLENVSVNYLVRTALADSRLPAGITVKDKFGEDLPEIPGDITQLKQVLGNVISNAVQAMQEQGTMQIRTGLNGSRMEVEIADNGPGIEAENLSKIFEPLFSTKAKGTGLGLAVCQSLVRGHGGEIKVKSRKGYGTTFTILLPLKKI